MTKSFLFIVLSLLFSFLSHSLAQESVPDAESGFVVEPYVGFERGYLTQKSVPEMTTQGLNFGARLGYRLWGVGLGLDYMASTQTATQGDQSGDFKPTDYGLFLSHKFEFGVSIYGSYFISAKSKIQSDENTQDFSGSGYKLGIGWRLYSFCEIALELISRKYTKYGSTEMANSLLGSTAGLSIAIPIL